MRVPLHRPDRPRSSPSSPFLPKQPTSAPFLRRPRRFLDRSNSQIRRTTHLPSLLVWCLVLVLVGDQMYQLHASLNIPTSNNYGDVSFLEAPAGPIDDAVTCQMEDLEQANDSQLFSILHELVQTTFFRTFKVDLEHKCPLAAWRPAASDHAEAEDDDDEEDDFECSGGADELDEDAEPLCTVQGDGEDDEDGGLGFLGSSTSSPAGLTSNALFSLSNNGFESKEQKATFSWDQHSDKIVTPDDDDEDSDCVDEDMLPEDFWTDLCTHVHNDDPTAINLVLNPERNTGYNGTHIWSAIYEENCLAVSEEDDAETCLEERVMYRLISGLHASTTVSIAKHYYPPSKRKGRTDWEANPTYFMEKFSQHPDHIRNLHFSYLVLLRALKKASPFLYQYNVQTSHVVDDETSTFLMRRLLDSSILQSCTTVFSAFDESLMFVDPKGRALQQNFKGVFQNISSILDCVQCQQCKLHGKMAMLGYGTALKILFAPTTDYKRILDRNEIVALVNTLAKFSESIRDVRELTQQYHATDHSKSSSKQDTAKQQPSAPRTSSSTTTTTTTDGPDRPATPMAAEGFSWSAVDQAVGATALLGRQGRLSTEDEALLVDMALRKQPELLILAHHYGTNSDKFLHLVTNFLKNTTPTQEPIPDAIVIGSGLAGMSATLNILDRGGSVVLIEKEHLLGGNSNKASSGINACCPDDDHDGRDSFDVFVNDTIRSAGAAARPDLVEVLVSRSASAVEWLRSRVGVDLSLRAQLGGHSASRTHRPSNGMAGAEIIFGVQKAIKEYQKKTDRVRIMVDTKVTSLVQDEEGNVVGVEYVSTNGDGDDMPQKLYAHNVILTTGGFAADRSDGSYLSQYRPELLGMPTTAGPYSTGDGITLATALGATVVDMDKVQVHPTGWVDPTDPDNRSKILAAELMRGVGGVLLNDQGERFCNELGTRAYVTDQMLSHNPEYAATKEWNVEDPIPTFALVLSSSAAAKGKKHIDLYSHKGLLTKFNGVMELADWMNLPKAVVIKTLESYQSSASNGIDEYGKKFFPGVPAVDLENEVFYAGRVTPVLHYCMGGITIDTEGYVLNGEGDRIPGLHAAGEVTGGVHGVNRLGGNSLLECTVFGSLVGKKISIHTSQQQQPQSTLSSKAEESSSSDASPARRNVSRAELAQHNSRKDCWVAIHGIVYDMTEFVDEHPAGPQSIVNLAGTDGTAAFSAVHNPTLLDEFEDDIIGVFLDDIEEEEEPLEEAQEEEIHDEKKEEVVVPPEPVVESQAAQPTTSAFFSRLGVS